MEITAAFSQRYSDFSKMARLAFSSISSRLLIGLGGGLGTRD